MIDGTAILLRTTACTLIAFCLARLLLVRVSSPRVHQVAWVLVLLQGWMVAPGLIYFSIPVPSGDISTDKIASVDIEPSGLPAPVPEPSIDMSMGDSESLEPFPWLSTLWLLGIGGTLSHYMWRYQTSIRQIPLGQKPEQMWSEEWQRTLRQAEVRRHRIIQFRISDNVGPLCCYVPFFYLVLVPRRLWRGPKQRTAYQHTST